MGEGATNHPTTSKIRSLNTHSQTCKLRSLILSFSFSLFLFLIICLLYFHSLSVIYMFQGYSERIQTTLVLPYRYSCISLFGLLTGLKIVDFLYNRNTPPPIYLPLSLTFVSSRVVGGAGVHDVKRRSALTNRDSSESNHEPHLVRDLSLLHCLRRRSC